MNELKAWFDLLETLGKMASKTNSFIKGQDDLNNESYEPMDWRRDIKYDLGQLLADIDSLAVFYDISIDECKALHKSLED